MKKTIAVLAALAVMAGSAFAEVNLSGTVFGGVTVIGFDDQEDSPNNVAGSSLGRVRIEATGETEDGTFGAWARFNGAIGDQTVRANGYAWWKPIDMLKMYVGVNPDGHWGMGKMNGWGFYGDANDLGVALTGFGANLDLPLFYSGKAGFDYGKWNGFQYQAAGFGKNGLLLEITPTDALSVNIGVPYIDYAGEDAWKVYRGLYAEVNINAGPGTINLAYEGVTPSAQNRWDTDKNLPAPLTNNGYASAAYYLDGIDNLAVMFGVKYALRGDNITLYDKDGEKTDTRGRQDPLWIGLGVTYDMDPFGIKFRTEVGILGDAYNTLGGYMDGEYSPFEWKADLLPYFAINENMKAFLGLGMRYVAKTDYGSDWQGYVEEGAFSFGVSPYVEIGILGNASLFAGFKLVTDTTTLDGVDPVTNFSIPVGLRVNF